MKRLGRIALLAALSCLPIAAGATNPCDVSPEACKAWNEALNRMQADTSFRFVSTMQRRYTGAVSVEIVIRRLSEAAERLIRADKENPESRRTDNQLLGNPYHTAPGDNGKVDSKEAQSTRDPMAVAFFEAAADYLGEAYLEGGIPGGFVDKIMPAFEISHGELRLFEQHLEGIVSSLDTDKSGTLDDAKMSGLAAAIASYSKTAFRGESARSARLSPLAWAKVEAVVRRAYAGPAAPGA